jgi:hypothetical protein
LAYNLVEGYIWTWAYAKRLRARGASEDQAEAHAEALVTAVEGQIATKADIRDMATKADLAELRADLLRWRSDWQSHSARSS